MILFGLKDHKLEYWEKGKQGRRWPNVRDLTSAGYDIVAAVVNSANERPYTGSMAIDLDVTIHTQILNRASIRVLTTGTLQWYDGSSTGGAYVSYNSGKLFREGTLNDGRFSTSWNEVSTVRNTGSWDIAVDFSSMPAKVTYFKVVETNVSGTETETWTIEASGTCAITGRKDAIGNFEFIARGSTSRTTSNRSNTGCRIHPRNTGNNWVLTEFDANSHITIILQ